MPTVLQDPSSKGLQDIPVYKCLTVYQTTLKVKIFKGFYMVVAEFFITLLILQCPRVPCLIVWTVHVN